MTWHYMHQTNMKRWGFIKNKVMTQLVAIIIHKTSWIPHMLKIKLTTSTSSTLAGLQPWMTTWPLRWCSWIWKFIGPHGSNLSLITQNNDQNHVNYKEGANIQLCDHVTSLLWIIASNIQSICLAQVNKSVHSINVFNQVENGLGNLVD